MASVDKVPPEDSHRLCERGWDILAFQQRGQLPGTDPPVFSPTGVVVADHRGAEPGPDWLVGAGQGREGPEGQNGGRIADHFERRGPGARDLVQGAESHCRHARRRCAGACGGRTVGRTGKERGNERFGSGIFPATRRNPGISQAGTRGPRVLGVYGCQPGASRSGGVRRSVGGKTRLVGSRGVFETGFRRATDRLPSLCQPAVVAGRTR